MKFEKRLSNYVLIIDLTHVFNGLSKDNCKMRREALKFWNMMRFILGVLWFVLNSLDGSLIKRVVFLCVFDAGKLQRSLFYISK